MRWLIFIVIYILIDIYAFQALKTITPNKIWHYSYLILSLLVVGNLIFQNIVPQEGSVVSGNRSYAFGLMLAMLAPKLILVIFMFGEDIIR
ncbi:MAG TPA: phosphoesterase, partial [Flavobacteriaceae bacterium]|nr:phosphoesterase [Flavobacteriaceae bacterium]